MTEEQRQDILDGAKVRVAHLRFYEGEAGLLFSRFEADKLGLGAPLPHGGLTLVQIELADGSLSRGAAACSKRENYCKAIGRMIATGRAVKLALCPPELEAHPDAEEVD